MLSRLVITFLPRSKHLLISWLRSPSAQPRKDLHDPENHDGVITHLEPDILEWEVKWAFGSITTNKDSGGGGIPAKLFQVLKNDAVKVPANLENSAVATGLEKVSFQFSPKGRQCQRRFKLPHN